MACDGHALHVFSWTPPAAALSSCDCMLSRSHLAPALPSNPPASCACCPAPSCPAVTLVNAHPGLQAGCPLQCKVAGLHAVEAGAGTSDRFVCAHTRPNELYYGARTALL